ncbi:uncharacterized protein EV420DRAFT_711264 [Desarmillaria tabescens]|uniref:F-box domain-containing protein n=1 Tax=Armillaria tabescens TaxID=1929756 RepID=A0AA39MZ70_ARMTA|nr:uncharacterized protein EV420DRAFT_711264 [Desarmillaria tabescens]KAK0451310.1 hypothetical protein EV420DRAFT_711264 [Desarmillaria tabescens]
MATFWSKYDSRACSPISTLPVELLTYIFSLATHGTPVATEGKESPLFDSESVKMPTRLSAVSKHWRMVARNTPALWTSLCATIASIHKTCHNGQRLSIFHTSHLSSHLSLSRNHALDIIIDARDPDWDFSEPSVEPECPYTPPFSYQHMMTVMSMLHPHIHHWRSFSILTDTWFPMHVALLYLSNAPAPLLESLTIMRCNDYISHASEFQPAALNTPFVLNPRTNRLRTLTLRGVYAEWSSLSVLRELEVLEITSLSSDVRPSTADMHGILSACAPRLRKLRLMNDAGPSSRDDHAVRPVTLPKLEDISIGYRADTARHGLAKLLIGPNVRQVTLENDRYPGDALAVDPGDVLSGLTFPLMERVALKDISASLESMQQFLMNVRHLEIEWTAVKCLLPLPDGSRSCPKLETLCLRSSDIEGINDLGIDAILGVLRVRGTSALREVEVHVSSAYANTCSSYLADMEIQKPRATRLRKTLMG